MKLKGIIAISGMSGLFKALAKTTNGGFVVESLSDKRRFPVPPSSRISALEDISVYTESEDFLLSKIFDKIKETYSVDLPVQPKDDASKLRSFFKNILPEYDETRVFTSDIKKIITWYLLLKDIPEVHAADEPEAAEVVAETAAEAVSKEAVAEKETKTKAKTTKTAAPKAKKEGEKTPAKASAKAPKESKKKEN